MKVQLVSDLHLEFLTRCQQDILLSKITSGPVPDLTVLAGDVCPYVNPTGAAFLRELCQRRTNVVMVPGNHELYGGSADKIDAHISDLVSGVAQNNFRILRRGIETIDGQRIVGCTMWYGEPPGSLRIRDFNVIDGHAPWVYEESTLDWRFLNSEVQPGDLVVTHLLPSHKCVDQFYKHSPTNHFFVQPMDDLINQEKPAAWCYGHTHSGARLEISDTKLYCNPKGYPNEKQTLPFDPLFTFDI